MARSSIASSRARKRETSIWTATTRIPEGEEWRLVGPTDVVCEADSDAGGTYEDSTRIEIIVDGSLRTSGSSTDRVRFTSTDEDSDFADDWYGILSRGNAWADGATNLILEDAELAYAYYPVRTFYADSVRVLKSRFHTYLEDAVTDFKSDATIQDCRFEPGPTQQSGPKNAVRVTASFTTMLRDTVLAQTANGIFIQGDQSYCLGTPNSGSGTITIDDCEILGPLDGTPNGINASWSCHEADLLIEDCNIQGWGGRGIRAVGSSDLTVRCNCILGNDVGIQHKRFKPTIDAANGLNRFRRNNLVENLSLNFNSLDGPYDGAHGLKFGSVNDGATGENRVELLDGVTSYNYRLWGSETGGRSDSAQANRWFDGFDNELDADPQSQYYINDFNEIRMNQTLVINSPATSDPTCSSSCSAVGSVARRGSRLSSTVEEGSAEEPGGQVSGVMLPEDLPGRLALHAPSPNPSRGHVAVRFDVPADHAGEVLHLNIYDVQGRRVASLSRGEVSADRHRFVWDQAGLDGKRVSPGVFFVQARIGGYRATRKITVLR